MFLALTAIVVAANCAPSFDENALADYVRGKGAFGVLLYVGAAALGSAAGIPRQGLSFVAGYAYGAFYGLVFATCGTILGCAGSFFLARFVGKPFMTQRFASRIRRLDAFIASAPFTMTLTVRCLPVGNNAATNIIAGLSSIPALGFIAGSFVGYIPQNFIFALLGSGIRVEPFWRAFIAAVLFASAAALGVMLFRRHKATLFQDEKNLFMRSTDG